MTSHTEEVISHILNCLPDKNHQTNRLLFCSLLKISQDKPKQTVQYILNKFETIPKAKHEGKRRLFVTIYINLV